MIPNGWIEVTQLDGNRQTISISQIVSIRVPAVHEFGPGASSVVEFVNGKFQAVMETPDAVVSRSPIRLSLHSGRGNPAINSYDAIAPA
jgi:hypothetical protein